MILYHFFLDVAGFSCSSSKSCVTKAFDDQWLYGSPIILHCGVYQQYNYLSDNVFSSTVTTITIISVLQWYNLVMVKFMDRLFIASVCGPGKIAMDELEGALIINLLKCKWRLI
jgi:hypothetical protein